MRHLHAGALVLAITVTFSACSGAGPATRETVALRYAADADAAWHAGQYEKAARRYERAVHEARANDNQHLVYVLLIRQSTALVAAGRADLALPRALEALDLAKLRGDSRHEAMLTLGQCYALGGDEAQARQALLAAVSGRGCVGMAAGSGLGALSARRQNHTAARTWYAKAAKNSCQEASVRAQLAYNWGRLLERRGEHQQALKRLRTSIGYFQRARDETGLADALHALGKVHETIGQLQKAADAFRRAGHTAWAVGRAKLAAWNFGLASAALRKLGRKVEADELAAQGRAALSASKTSSKRGPQRAH
ncbi:MAG TPA: hypothetical protein DCQ06_09590 [Myxococcales bacterium]|nr:hypothetical protein [Myxococcales bacterium]HAN31836.1 hypothetical protein [Myxococcales bacterium]